MNTASDGDEGAHRDRRDGGFRRGRPAAVGEEAAEVEHGGEEDRELDGNDPERPPPPVQPHAVVKMPASLRGRRGVVAVRRTRSGHSWPPSWRAAKAGRRARRRATARASRRRAAISVRTVPQKRGRGRGAGDSDADGAVASRSPALRGGFVHEHIAYFFPSLSNAPSARRRAARAQTRPVVLACSAQQRPQLPTRFAAREYHARVRRRDPSGVAPTGPADARLSARRKRPIKRSAGNPIGRKFFRIADTGGENRGKRAQRTSDKKM